MQIPLKNWGNSKGLRLPKKILEAINWQGEDFNIKVDKDRLIVDKVPLEEYIYNPNNETQFLFGKVKGNPIYFDMSEPLYTNVLIVGASHIADELVKQILLKKSEHEVRILDNKQNDSEKLQEIIELLLNRNNSLRTLGVVNIKDYNKQKTQPMKRIFLVIRADRISMSEKNIDYLLQLLARGRAVGIHVILIENDFRKLLSGTVVNNCPVRISQVPFMDAIAVSILNDVFLLD